MTVRELAELLSGLPEDHQDVDVFFPSTHASEYDSVDGFYVHTLYEENTPVRTVILRSEEGE